MSSSLSTDDWNNSRIIHVSRVNIFSVFISSGNSRKTIIILWVWCSLPEYSFTRSFLEDAWAAEWNEIKMLKELLEIKWTEKRENNWKAEFFLQVCFRGLCWYHCKIHFDSNSKDAFFQTYSKIEEKRTWKKCECKFFPCSRLVKTWRSLTKANREQIRNNVTFHSCLTSALSTPSSVRNVI